MTEQKVLTIMKYFFQILCSLAIICFYKDSFAIDTKECTLEEAIIIALKNNYSIHAIKDIRDASIYKIDQIKIQFAQSISSNYGITKWETSNPYYDLRGKEQYVWSISIIQNIFSGFHTKTTWENAIIERDIQNLEISKKSSELIDAVQYNFYYLLKAEASITAAEASLKRLNEQLRISKELYKEGMASKIDLLTAELEISKAESNLLSAQNERKKQILKLNSLLSIPENSIKYIGKLKKNTIKLTLNECLILIENKNPEIGSNKKNIEIAKNNITLAKSSFYPKVDIHATWSTSGNDASVKGNKLQTTGFSSWGFGVNFEWSIFNFGENYRDVKRAEKLYSSAKNNYISILEDKKSILKTYFLELKNITKNISVYRKNIDQANIIFKTEQEKYIEKMNTIHDVLNSEATLRQAEKDYIESIALYNTTVSKIYLLVGLEQAETL